MSKVVIRPSIFFDPAQTGWTSITQFNDWFGRALAQSGLEAENVPTYPNQEVVYLVRAKAITEIPDVSKMSSGLSKPLGRPKSIRGHIESLMPKTTVAEKNYKKGKFLKSKGYLKKE